MRKRVLASALVLVALVAALWIVRGGRVSPAGAPPGAPRGPAPAEPADLLAPDEGGEAPRASLDPWSEPSASATDAVAAERPGALLLRGRALDARTGEPIPELALLIGNDEGDEDTVVTDAEGRFLTRQGFLRGEIAVSCLDPDAADDARVRFEDPAREQELLFEIGPTYFLDLELPAGRDPAEFRARVASSASPSLATGGDWSSQSIRTGDPPWVRFQRDQVESDVLPRLVVVSEDGVWGGSAPVDSVVGRHPGLVRITFEARASIRGVVLRERERPDRAWIKLIMEQFPDGILAHTGAGGAFRFGGLPAGRCRLEVTSDESGGAIAELELVTGVETVHDFLLAAEVPAGAIHGIVRSTSGTYTCEGEVCLWGTAGSLANRRDRLQWKEEGGALVHRFSFEDVPAGRYRLVLLIPGSPCEIAPEPELVASPPQGPIEFEIQDTAPRTDIVFRARAADTEELIDGFTVWYRPPRGWFAMKEAQGAEVVIEDYPIARPFAWIVGRPGLELAEGDETMLRQEGERRVAEVRLRPGWGAQFFVEDAEGAGIEGISLLFDDVPVGPSRAEGRLPVSLPRRPERVSAGTSGWRVVGGKVDPVSGVFDDAEWWAIPVVVARE